MPGTNINTPHIPQPALLNQGTTDILSDIVPNEHQRNPIAAAEVCKRSANLVSGSKRKDITPVRS
jgi:hypothetical protein